VRHFDNLTEEVRQRLFHIEPQHFDASSGVEVLSLALGATLYIPGVRDDLENAIRRRVAKGVRSMVIDLEDAVEDARVEDALELAVAALRELGREPVDAMLFVRVRNADHIREVSARLNGEITALTGFVIPKFSPWTGEEFLEAIIDASELSGHPMFAMPVLETPEVIYRESRDAVLTGIRELLNRYRDMILAVRIGATDLSGLFGIRRDRDLIIYDVRVVADLISDMVNHLGRPDGTGFTLTGPVWEYFANHERLFRPQLRATPFGDADELRLRQRLVLRDLDGLIREVTLDRANGLQGKTVIHPTHVPAVHALSVVSHEEFTDAMDVLEIGGSGVRASGYRNKMNELGPHRRWAERIMLQAGVFGVAGEDVSFVELLAALADQ